MARYKLLVLSNPVAGREDEFNDWYSNQHIQDIVALPNGVSGQRFLIEAPAQWKYAAIYELDGDDIGSAIGAMRAETGKSVRMSDTLDLAGALMLPLNPITELVTK